MCDGGRREQSSSSCSLKQDPKQFWKLLKWGGPGRTAGLPFNHQTTKMTKLLAFACLVLSASAFAPAHTPMRSVAVSGLGEWTGWAGTTPKKGADGSWKDEQLKEQLKILAMRKSKAKKSARAAKPAPRRAAAPRAAKPSESFAARDHTPAGHIDLIGALGNIMGAEDNRNGPRP